MPERKFTFLTDDTPNESGLQARLRHLRRVGAVTGAEAPTYWLTIPFDKSGPPVRYERARFFDIGHITNGQYPETFTGVLWNSTGREFLSWQAGVGRRLLKNRPSQLNGESEYALAA